MKIAAVMLLILGGTVLLQAQNQDQSEQPPPTGPLLSRASSPAEWSVTIKTDASTGAAGNGASTSVAPANATNQAKPQIMVVIKDLDLIFEKTALVNGDVMESWHEGNWAVSKTNGSNWIVAPGAGNGNTFNTVDYAKADFAGFAWISLNNFSGRRMVMGKKCLIFKDKVITIDPAELEIDRGGLEAKGNVLPNNDRFKVDVEADIDDATRLPVMLIFQAPRGQATRTYSFRTPEGSLSLPPEVKQLLDKYNLYIKRMSGRIAPI